MQRFPVTLRTAALVTVLATPMLVTSASAQSGVDTNGDGVADDFDRDKVADHRNSDCIPTDFNGDGEPDADTIQSECAEGSGGFLPDQLGIQAVARILDIIYLKFSDSTVDAPEPDGFPTVPRLFEGGVDVGPNWEELNRLLGEHDARDLLHLGDDHVNQEMLEFADINNAEFTNPITGEVEFVATP